MGFWKYLGGAIAGAATVTALPVLGAAGAITAAGIAVGSIAGVTVVAAGRPGPSANRRKSKSTDPYVRGIVDRPKTLVPGSIVVCDLASGFADHSGIYVGRNRIIELNGDGYFRKVSPQEFVSDGTLRTGKTIYVACRDGNPITARGITSRARQALGTRVNYCEISNNCHKFTAHCVTGWRPAPTTFAELEELLTEQFGEIHWEEADLSSV